MELKTLGRTNLKVSAIGLGAGPVPALMTGSDGAAQRAVLERCRAVGINWIDTAAGYGDGRSEASLGRALAELGAHDLFHIATKVRLTPEDFGDVERAVRRSLTGSFQRLCVERVTLLQLHNGVTTRRGAIAAGLAPEDVRCIVPTFERLRREGLVQFVGLTGTGDSAALGEVLADGAFDTIQVPHHVLSPAASSLLALCEKHDVGVFAIRVFAGGALLGNEPSAHTLKTPYFPLAVYEEERRRAAALGATIGAEMSLKELALRFALSAAAPQVALVGLSEPGQVDEVAALAARGSLPTAWHARLAALHSRGN
jgi:D-threo-aldose 1-dehydrogenase